MSGDGRRTTGDDYHGGDPPRGPARSRRSQLKWLLARLCCALAHGGGDLLPTVGPRLLRDAVRLLMIEERPLELVQYQPVNQFGLAHMAISFALVWVKWGHHTQNGLHSTWLQST
jgi:hypothetical protein